MRMRCFISIVGFIFLILSSIQSYAATRTEFILDVSGSMNKMFGGEKRIDAAKKAVASAVASIPEGSIVALRLYAHRIPQTDKAASCKDTELVVPFGPVNKQQIIDTVNRVSPLGQTPIAYSIEQAANDFNLGTDEQPVIILASDGEESCGGDPVAVAKALLAKGFKVKIHTVGIDVDANAKAQLEAISNATGGTYKDAKDTAGLTASLRQLTEESFIKKENVALGEAIRGGDSFDTAVQIQPEKVYHLDHHQRKDQYDYFYVDTKAGQAVQASIETSAQGIRGEGVTATPEGLPYAGITLLTPQRQKVGAEDIIGTANSKKTVSGQVPSGGEGKYYIMIGNSYESQHKDTRFQVNLVSKFDANSQQDAGDNDATALEVVPGTYDKNYLSKADPMDVFKFKAAANVAYEIKVRPQTNNQLEVKVMDPDGIQLASADSSTRGSAIRIENVKLNKEGYVYIRVGDHDFRLGIPTEDAVYSLTIAAADGSTAPSSTTAPTVIKGPDSNTSSSPAGSITEQQFCQNFKGLSFLGKAKMILLYMGIPVFIAFLAGYIFGYVKGRKSGKRKAMLTMSKS